MNDTRQQLEHLAEMRSLMERSTRFLSLSGLSGVWAGLCALAGVYVVYQYLNVEPLGFQDTDVYYGRSTDYTRWGMDYRSVFVLIATLVLAAALAGGVFFTTRKARMRGERVWDASTRRLLWAMAVPLFAGGIFTLALLYRGYVGFLAPSTLVFYGLALINGSKYTLRDVEQLGMLEIGLGLIGMFYPVYGLDLWAVGFGLLHIFYGTWMYWKYERPAK